MDYRRVLGYGFLLWLVPFLASFAIFPLKAANPYLYSSILFVLGVAVAGAVSLAYFSDGESGWVPGLSVGLAWLLISIALDSPFFFLWFNYSPLDYLSQVGVGYLAIPAITLAVTMARSQAGSGRKQVYYRDRKDLQL